jgi:hypothetical protein
MTHVMVIFLSTPTVGTLFESLSLILGPVLIKLKFILKVVYKSFGLSEVAVHLIEVRGLDLHFEVHKRFSLKIS